MSNVEGRNTSEALMMNLSGDARWPFRHSGLVILSDFVIRHFQLIFSSAIGSNRPGNVFALSAPSWSSALLVQAKTRLR
jgi:hypothetical protein